MRFGEFRLCLVADTPRGIGCAAKGGTQLQVELPWAGGRDPRLLAGPCSGLPGVPLSLEQHSGLVRVLMMPGTEGQLAVLALGTLLSGGCPTPTQGQSPHLAPQRGCRYPRGTSLPRCHLSCPVTPRGGTAPSAELPRGTLGSVGFPSPLPLLSLFPRSSHPLPASPPSPGFCSFSPLPLPPPRSLPPSPIPAPAAQPVSIKYRSPVLYQWSAELTSPARCFSPG